MMVSNMTQNWACHSEIHFWDYYSGVMLSSLQIIWDQAPTGARSSNKFHWLDPKLRHQKSSSSNAHQDNMPYCIQLADYEMEVG